MKNILIYTILIISFIGAQDNRSTIFGTGTPDTDDGYYTISGNISIADRFYVSYDYAMEGFSVRLAKESEQAEAIVSIHSDSNNSPGEVLGSWNVPVTLAFPFNYATLTFDNCITFDAGSYYWISVRTNPLTDHTIRWIYSPDDTYTYSRSIDSQQSWETSAGFAGAGSVSAERFYDPEPLYGDVNQDSQLNVLDVVAMVSYVVGESDLSQEQLELADTNLDGSLDVLDIVYTVGVIVNNNPMPVFSLLDFNPNSSYNGQYIGPETFSNEVSCYYFGKQG